MSPANTRAYEMFVSDRAEYEAEIRRLVCREDTIGRRCELEVVSGTELKKRMLSDAYTEPSENHQQNRIISLV
jgi:hypothetical protein